MLIFKRGIRVFLAVLMGLFTLFSLIFAPALADMVLDWAGFLAAAALLLGILNLFSVHLRRSGEGNVYSVILVLSILSVFGLAITDALGQTEQGVQTIFTLIQIPLEAALASLLAFFLLFAGVRTLQERRNPGMILFLLSVLFFLLTQGLWAETLWSWSIPVREWIEGVIVVAGMRGLLLGIAIGVVTLAVRLLVGIERPYSS